MVDGLRAGAVRDDEDDSPEARAQVAAIQKFYYTKYPEVRL